LKSRKKEENRVKLKVYLELSRPFTAIFPFFAVLFGGLAGALKSGVSPSFTIILLAALAMTFAQMFGQVTNQLADPPELDMINGKLRPLVRGDITESEATNFVVVLLILTYIFARLVSEVYAFYMTLLVISILVYNFEPIRLKRRFMLNNLVLAFSRGFVPFIASYTLFSHLDKEAVLLAIGIAIWVFGWQTTKDIPDIDGDNKFGIKTIPVVLGAKTYHFIAVSSGLFVVYHLLLLKVIKPAILISVVFIPYTIFSLKHINDERKIIKGENKFGWVTFYVGIVLYYLVVFISNLTSPL